MSADEHLSGPQFQAVHRGIHLGDPDSPKTAALYDRIKDNPQSAVRAASRNTRFSSGHLRQGSGYAGVHWTDTQDVADKFAVNHWQTDHLGVTLHANVRNGSVMQPGTPEHTRAVQGLAILGEDGGEHEVTVRPGDRVQVTGVTIHHRGESTFHPVNRSVKA